MQIELTDAEDPAIRTAVLAPLAVHNAVSTGRDDPGGHLAVLLRDAQGAVEGGMYATHWQDWMKLEYTYVPAHLRGQGMGTRLLATLERATVARGCRGLWLQSFSVQAPGFYEKLGYRVVGRLKDRPRGHEDVFLAKTVADGLGQAPATLDVDETPDPAHRATLRRLLVAWTDARTAPANFRNLAVVLRGADGAILGGLSGYTGRDWLYVELFGLPPELRRDGLGSRLLRMAEEEGRARGCFGSYLDTFSFQARPFYEKQGYQVFGQIDGYPDDAVRFFLSKRLDG